jgi:hypothetical protein
LKANIITVCGLVATLFRKISPKGRVFNFSGLCFLQQETYKNILKIRKRNLQRKIILKLNEVTELKNLDRNWQNTEKKMF